MPSSTPPCVVVCAGKDCRRRDEFDDLRAELDGSSGTSVTTSEKCLGVCKGPVVLAHDPAADRAVLLTKLRSPKARRDLRRWLAGGHLTKRLDKRMAGAKQVAKALRRTVRAERSAQ